MQRDEVLVVVPPNSNTILTDRSPTATHPEELSDWSSFASLGALSLVSALETNQDLHPIYIDGTVTPLADILDYITTNRDRLLAVCLGMLTANYEVGLLIARHVKETEDRIVTVAGNDHFSSLWRQCMTAAPYLDYGFVGNEVIGPFTKLIGTLSVDADVVPADYPGLVHRVAAKVHQTSPHREPVFTGYDYTLLDRDFNHTSAYARQFGRRIAPRVRELLGRSVNAGVPVEIGRGCVKFAANDACSFCAIQPGHLWRNQLSPEQAWAAIAAAWDSGYDYLYLTADELPLTFAQLLTGMSQVIPAWWKALSVDERPIIVGYGRADGIADSRKTGLLTALGVRQIMIGMDAGAPISLAAMNKPVGGRHRDVLMEAEKLYHLNEKSITVARDHGMMIRAGFVLGHIGMTRGLLEENMERILALISAGSKAGVFSAVDVEILSPEPGAADYTYLTTPAAAAAAADRLGLTIADEAIRAAIGERWAGQDVVVPESAMLDYTRALMPDLDFEEIVSARADIRQHAKSCGVVIGE